VDDAGHNWDGDPRFGLGDYRIPAVMLTLPNNTRIDPPALKGIHGTADCVEHVEWQVSADLLTNLG